MLVVDERKELRREPLSVPAVSRTSRWKKSVALLPEPSSAVVPRLLLPRRGVGGGLSTESASSSSSSSSTSRSSMSTGGGSNRSPSSSLSPESESPLLLSALSMAAEFTETANYDDCALPLPLVSWERRADEIRRRCSTNAR